MIPLDIEGPFTRAVCAVMEGRARYEDAIDILIAAERKHGVRIIRDDGCGSLATALAPLDSNRPPTLKQFMELMSSFPQRGSTESLAAFNARRDLMYRVAADDEAPNERLFPFLTEVPLVISGTDFASNHWLEYSGGIVVSWTPRAWGRCLADWARATDWAPAHRTLWDDGERTYANFCYYLYTLVDRYDAWAAVVLEVIRRKCARQLSE